MARYASDAHSCVPSEMRIAMAQALCVRWQQSEFHRQFYELRSDEPELRYWLNLVDAVLDLLPSQPCRHAAPGVPQS